jgi:hypothetical protein
MGESRVPIGTGSQGRLARDQGEIRTDIVGIWSPEPDLAGICAAAREFVTAIEDQLVDLRGHNDPPTRDLIDFLEALAVGLKEIADALDQILGAPPDQQRLFLGTAGKIVDQLIGYIEAHRTAIAGYTVKVGLVCAGYNFLHAMGLGDWAAALASGLLGYKLPTEPKAKN